MNLFWILLVYSFLTSYLNVIFLIKFFSPAMFIKYEVSLQFKNQFRPTFHVDWVPLPHFLGIHWSNNTNMDDYDKFSCSIPYESYRIQVRLLSTGEHTSWNLKKCSSFLIAVNGVRFVILPRRNIKGNFSVVLKKEKESLLYF